MARPPALELADRVTDTEREKLRTDVALLAQKRAAAESLRGAGFIAEAIPIARSALDTGERIVKSIVPGDGDFAKALRDCGMRPAAAAWVAEVHSSCARAQIPVLEEEIVRAQRRLCADLLAACRHVERLVRWIPRSARRRRVRRIAPFAISALVVIVAIVAWTRPRRYSASASDRLSTEFSAALAIDGKNDTEWLLPDGTIGWLEVNLPRAQTVSRVRLLNCHNRNFNDRATERFRIELYSGHEPVQHVEARFPALQPSPQWLDVPVHGRDVDRVRFVVESWFQTGAGLAEIEVVP